jgi:hypothetical protein
MGNFPFSGGGSGAVSSVFTRTGAVVAQSGDYTAAQVGALSVTGGGEDTISALGNVTGTATANIASGNVITATMTGNTTWTFSGATNGVSCTFTLRLSQDGTGGRTATWPGSVSWAGGTAPTPSTAASALNVYIFQSLDGGTTWLGSLIQELPALPLAIASGGTGTTTAAAAILALMTGGVTFPAYVAPTVTTLTDGSSVALNAALGNDYRWTLGGSSHTLAAPSNPVNGQMITIAIKYSGSFTPLFNAVYDFGAPGAPTWSAASGKTDYVGFRYDSALNGAAGEWAYQGSILGLTS